MLKKVASLYFIILLIISISNCGSSSSSSSDDEFPGTEVVGIISEDTTWTKELSPYLIHEKVQIDYDVTLTIEPGVIVKGKRKYGSTTIFYNCLIEIWGTLSAIGTSSEKILMSYLSIRGRDPNCEINLQFVEKGYVETSTYPEDVYYPFDISTAGKLTISDCSYIDSIDTIWGENLQAELNINNSLYIGNIRIEYPQAVCNIQNSLISFIDITYPEAAVNIQRNVLGGAYFEEYNGFPILIRNNLVKGDDYTSCFTILTNDSNNIVVELNSFYEKGYNPTVQVYEGIMDLENNYWHTTDPNLIENMVYDSNDDLNLTGEGDYDPFLTAPASGTPLIDDYPYI